MWYHCPLILNTVALSLGSLHMLAEASRSTALTPRALLLALTFWSLLRYHLCFFLVWVGVWEVSLTVASIPS